MDREEDCRPVAIPDFVREVAERIAFLGRMEKRIDQRSGVSQRLPIAVIETVVSSAERRAIRQKEDAVIPRIGDIYASLPAITGKLELEYEGELHGAARIGRELVSAAAGATFDARAGGADLDSVVDYFEGGGVMQVSEDAAATACVQGFGQVPGLLEATELVGLGAGRERGRAQGGGVRAGAGGTGRQPADQPDARRRLPRSHSLSSAPIFCCATGSAHSSRWSGCAQAWWVGGGWVAAAAARGARGAPSATRTMTGR